jgi:hypothetical protein
MESVLDKVLVTEPFIGTEHRQQKRIYSVSVQVEINTWTSQK